jgi:hypothetical protein
MSPPPYHGSYSCGQRLVLLKRIFSFRSGGGCDTRSYSPRGSPGRMGGGGGASPHPLTSLPHLPNLRAHFEIQIPPPFPTKHGELLSTSAQYFPLFPTPSCSPAPRVQHHRTGHEDLHRMGCRRHRTRGGESVSV